MRQDGLPVLLARRPYGRGEETEVAAHRVRADVEEALAVTDVVLVTRLARLHDGEGGEGIARREKADLARRVRARGDEEEVPRARALDAEVEGVVLLLVDEVVLRASDRMPVELVGALFLWILDHVEQHRVVARPVEGIDAGDLLGA